jgi:hypothetical protein
MAGDKLHRNSIAEMNLAKYKAAMTRTLQNKEAGVKLF